MSKAVPTSSALAVPSKHNGGSIDGAEIGYNSPGEDPDVLRDLSDDSFAHGCSLWFASVCAEVFGVQTDAVIYEVVAAFLWVGR